MPVSGAHRALITAFTAAAVLAPTGVVHAAPPSNDDLASATTATTLPFSDTSSTVEATAGEDDPSSHCNGLGGSIWYAFTAPADMHVQADLVGSTFETVMDVYTGGTGPLESVDCAYEQGGVQPSLRFQVRAGTTYFVSVRSWGGQSSGDVTFTVRQAPPPLSSMAVDVQKGTVNRQGAVTVTGTVTCDSDAFASFAVSGVQVNRRFRAQGGESAAMACSTTPTSWSITFASQTGVNFVSGGMTANVSGEAYGNWGGHAVVSGAKDIRLTSTR